MTTTAEFDAIYDEFESVWKPEPGLVEGFVDRVSAEHRARVLQDLLEIEFELLIRDSGTPNLSDYVRRFPDQIGEINEALRKVQARLQGGESCLPSTKKATSAAGASKDPVSADRNLLFGVLAWQAGVINERQLLDGLKQWTFQKTQPLSDALIQVGALTADQKRLLEPMVDAQVQLHQNNVANALNALSSITGIAGSLKRQIDDSDVQHSLGLLATTIVPDRAGSEEANVRTERSSASRYTRRQFHAAGGLGEVYKAEDEELNREVALKQIRPEYARDLNARARFLLEAEITGGLEHPGIVPVYGLGHYEDGRPFYAMRFIKGQSLKEAIDEFHGKSKASRDDGKQGDKAESGERKAEGTEQPADHSKGIIPKTLDFNGLAFRKLLGRFIDVCQAIGYAHSRGVLHRDLKPGNIMLGKYGETLVVDWGLAKAKGRADVVDASDENSLRPSSGSGVAPTLAGSALGTPAYMPPEQATGDLAALGPSSDVYSLGATLFHALTGAAPFSGTQNEVLDQVKRGHVKSPLTFNATIPKSLAAVCLKAMALRPQDRYSSAQQIAEELERFLADEPVRAFREPFSVRTRRWVRKHQTAAVSTAAVLLVSVVGLSIFASMLSAANGREREARLQAEAHEKSAREQSQLALSTLTSVIEDIQGGLEDLPGGGEVRRRLLATSLMKLQSVSTEFLSQASVDRSTWRALINMGDVILTFGTRDDKENERTEDTQKELSSEAKSAVEVARLYFERAAEIATSLVQANPNDIQQLQYLSATCQRLGKVFLRLGRTNSALTQFQKCTKIVRILLDADSTNIDMQRDLSLAHTYVGDALLKLHHEDEAIRQYQHALNICRTLAKSDPVDAKKQSDLSVSHDRLGKAFLALGRTEHAITEFEEYVKISRLLARIDSSDFSHQSNLARSLDHLGQAFLKLDRTEDAIELFRESLTISRKISDADAANTERLHMLAVAHDGLGRTFRRMGELNHALAEFEAGSKILRNLAETDPRNVQMQHDLSIFCERLGDVFLEMDHTDDAIAQFETTLQIRRVLAKADPGNTQTLLDLLSSFSQLGNIYLKVGRSNDAMFEELSTTVRALAAADSRDRDGERALVASFELLGRASLAQGKAEDALTYFETELEIAARLMHSDPNDEESKRCTCIAHTFLGDVMLELDRNEEALAQLEDGVEISHALAASDLQDPEKQRHLAFMLQKLGAVYFHLRRWEDAFPKLEGSLKIRRKLVEADPENVKSKRELMFNYSMLGEVALALNNIQVAEQRFQESGSLLDEVIGSGHDERASQKTIEYLEQRLRFIRMIKLAMGEWETLLQLSDVELPEYLNLRGMQCCKRQRFADAEQAASKLHEFPNVTNRQLYNAACVFSLCATAIKAEEGTELTANQASKREELIQQSLESLKLAIDKGWNDFAHMQQDSDLAPLHDLPEFKALIPAQTANPEPVPEATPAEADAKP